MSSTIPQELNNRHMGSKILGKSITHMRQLMSSRIPQEVGNKTSDRMNE